MILVLIWVLLAVFLGLFQQCEYRGGNMNYKGGDRRLILIPFGDLKPEQNRSGQLEKLLACFKDLCTTKHGALDIVIAEQIEPRIMFNKGRVLNHGYAWYKQRHGRPSHVVVHDVDMLPNDRVFQRYFNTYKVSPMINMNTASFRKLYNGNCPIGGGVTGFASDVFEKINGFPNHFWGWGGEDNAVHRRVKSQHVPITWNDDPDASFENLETQREKGDAAKMKYLDSSAKLKRSNEEIEKDIVRDRHNFKRDGLKQVQQCGDLVQGDQQAGDLPKNLRIFRVKMRLTVTRSILASNR